MKDVVCGKHTYIIASKMVQASYPVRYFWRCHNCKATKWMSMDGFKKYCQENFEQIQ